MSIAKEFEHNGKTVKLYYDEDPLSPRDADNLGIMLAEGHRGYTLGDEQFLKGKHSEYDDAARAFHYYGKRRQLRLFPRWCSIHLGSSVVLALGLIDHSGISMYVANSWATTGDASNQFDPGGWDSGLVGFIFDTASTREMTGAPLDSIEEQLRNEVKEYDRYLTGDVYGYVIEDEDGNEVDSCWGFIGLEYAVQSARDEAGYTCKHCDMEIVRWVGPVVDEEPEGGVGFVHNCCAECLRDIAWGGDGWYHNTVMPWEWPNGKPDHAVTRTTHRHACVNGTTFAETNQEVGQYT